MHAMCSQTQSNAYTKMNLSTVKWAQWDKTQSRELLGLFICVCIALCTIVAQNTAQNRPDNFPSCPPDNRRFVATDGCLAANAHQPSSFLRQCSRLDKQRQTDCANTMGDPSLRWHAERVTRFACLLSIDRRHRWVVGVHPWSTRAPTVSHQSHHRLRLLPASHRRIRLPVSPECR